MRSMKVCIVWAISLFLAMGSAYGAPVVAEPKAQLLKHAVTLLIHDGTNPDIKVENVPWYPGETVLQAMIVANSISGYTFNFKVDYSSFWGALVTSINGIDNSTTNFWMFKIDGVDSDLGASQKVIGQSKADGQVSIVEWYYSEIKKDPPSK